MLKKKLPPELQSLREGFIAGILVGIVIKTGTDIGETGLMITVFREVCKVTENGAGHMNCGLIILLLSITAILITIYSILKEVVKVRGIHLGKKYLPGIAVGLVIYGVGFLAGVILICQFT